VGSSKIGVRMCAVLVSGHQPHNGDSFDLPIRYVLPCMQTKSCFWWLSHYRFYSHIIRTGACIELKIGFTLLTLAIKWCIYICLFVLNLYWSQIFFCICRVGLSSRYWVSDIYRTMGHDTWKQLHHAMMGLDSLQYVDRRSDCSIINL
jgi:hypothetical protein